MYTTLCNLLNDLQVGGNKILLQTMFCFHQVLPLELSEVRQYAGGKSVSMLKVHKRFYGVARIGLSDLITGRRSKPPDIQQYSELWLTHWKN